jgi:hypothetical protein
MGWVIDASNHCHLYFADNHCFSISYNNHKVDNSHHDAGREWDDVFSISKPNLSHHCQGLHGTVQQDRAFGNSQLRWQWTLPGMQRPLGWKSVTSRQCARMPVESCRREVYGLSRDLGF